MVTDVQQPELHFRQPARKAITNKRIHLPEIIARQIRPNNVIRLRGIDAFDFREESAAMIEQSVKTDLVQRGTDAPVRGSR